MKKTVLFLSVLLFITGCSITRIDNATIDDVVNKSLSEKITYRNAIGKGYKYYIPQGVIRQSIDDYNEKLFSNDDVYYLFIDVVSYLNKTKPKSPTNKGNYYYKELDNGYISIIKDENKYLAKIYYNYAYIESYISKNNINEAISNILFILKTMNFKKNILTSGASNEIVNNYEETYTIKSEGQEKVDFLEYEELYGKYTGPDIELGIQEKESTNLETDIITNKKTEE